MSQAKSQKTALIVGSTGIVGLNLSNQLLAQGWKVYGLARTPANNTEVIPVAADLLNATALETALKDVSPTHIFITTWMRQPTEAENIKLNSAMVRNVLKVVGEKKTLKHAALVTGLKHYLGPFEAYGKGKMPPTPFREDQARLDVANFYYAQEDEVFEAAKKYDFTWSVHRPHTIIGFAIGNAMNMGVTLAVYASLCKASGRPFYFPGSNAQWNGVTDMTDARILAKHLEWASFTPAAANEAFNIVNGDVFRWSWMWSQIANWFDIEPAAFTGEILPLEKQMADAAQEWESISKKNGLAESNLAKLTSAWHTDADLGRPLEVIADMGKSRRLGFREFQQTDQSFFDLFTELRAKKIIP